MPTPPTAPLADASPAADYLLDTMPWGLLVLGPQGTIVRLNQQAASWWGQAPAAVQGRPLGQAGPGSLPEPGYTALQQAARGLAEPLGFWLAAEGPWLTLTSASQPSGEVVVYWQASAGQALAPARLAPTPPAAGPGCPRPGPLAEGTALVEVLLDGAGQPADYRFLAVTPAVGRQLGLAEAVGKTSRELAPGAALGWLALCGQVALTGEPQRAEEYVAATAMWYEVRATRSGAAAHQQVAVEFADVTARRRAEMQLRRAAQANAFRVALTDALRPLTDPLAVQATAARLLGQQLGVHRAFYSEIVVEDGVEYFDLSHGYLAAAPPAQPGRYPVASFGASLAALLHAGQRVVVDDTEADTRLDAAARRAYQALGVRAWVGMPLFKNGQLVALLGVNALYPRQWQLEELALLEEVGERTWAAIGRTRAEAALAESETRYRSLFDSIDEAFMLCQLLHDEHGRATDYRLLELNSAFEAMTGLRVAQAQGRTARELAPTLEEWWVETYANMLLDGQARRFERYVPDLNRWFDIYAAPVGAPGSDKFVVVYANITQRKLAELALRKSEEQFRTVVSLVPDLLWRTDAQAHTTWLNQRWLDYTGQALAAALGRGWLACIHPDDQPGSEAAFRQAIATGRPLRHEHRIRSAGGEYRWFLAQAQPVADEHGAVQEWLGAATDIHERRLAEAQAAATQAQLERQVAERTHQLRESRDLLQSVFDASLTSMAVLQAERDEAGAVIDFRLVLVNKELARATGRPHLVGKRYTEEYPGMRPAGLFALMLRALATGTPQSTEYHYTHEGFDRWFSCLFVRLGDGLVATNLDITERKIAEQERAQNMRQLEQAEAVAGLGSWNYELATGRLHWSSGMYQLFGLAPGRAVAPSFYLEAAVPGDQPLARQLVHRITTGAADFEHTLRLRLDGEVKTVRVKAEVLRNAQGQPVRVQGVDLNVSPLHRLETDNLRLRLSQQQALFEAVQGAQEEERRRIAESLHNGIGQILYATKLQLDRLPPQPQEAARLLNEAIRQTRALSHELTPALLEEFGLEATLQSICTALSTPTLRWRCHLVLDEAPPLPAALQLAVYRLAQELTHNVAKHAQAREAILEVEALPAWVVLRVEDDGCGFDPARTSDGLGLRTLRTRVALLGGSVHLATAEGQGTQCQLRLPLAAAHAG